MRRAIVILVPTFAAADVPHPEELSLGEVASLQDAMELQVSAMPSQTRAGWEQRYAIEFGITRRLQVAVEGEWIEDGERELEFGAMVGIVRGEHVALSTGAEVSTEGEVEPVASVLAGTGRFGANLAIASSIEGEARAAAALFARFSRFTPVVEFGASEIEYAWRGGVAAALGSVELMLTGGYGTEAGPSAHVLLSWEIEFADDDDDDEDDADDRKAAMR